MLVKPNNLVNQYFLKLRTTIERFLRDALCGEYVAEAACSLEHRVSNLGPRWPSRGLSYHPKSFKYGLFSSSDRTSDND